MSNAIAEHGGKKSLLTKFSHNYGVEPNKMMNTLISTAFHQRNGQQITNEQMMALLVVADQYSLNPFTKEIYAFPDKNAGIVPIVGVDGWARIINEHPAFDGMVFSASTDVATIDEHHKTCPEYITCTMYRKDRGHPIEVTEYLDEVYRPPFVKNGYAKKGPWQSHTKRFLRHKAMIQCARLAFGFTGIYDQDEGERIVGAGSVSHTNPGTVQTDIANGNGCISNIQANQIKTVAYDAGVGLVPILEQLGVPDVQSIPADKFALVLGRLRHEQNNTAAAESDVPAANMPGDIGDFSEYDNTEAFGAEQ